MARARSAGRRWGSAEARSERSGEGKEHSRTMRFEPRVRVRVRVRVGVRVRRLIRLEARPRWSSHPRRHLVRRWGSKPGVSAVARARSAEVLRGEDEEAGSGFDPQRRTARI